MLKNIPPFPVLPVLFLFVFSFTNKIQGQSNLPEPAEKIYFLLDKNNYNPGEDVWFSASIFAGRLPSSISKTLFVEVMTPEEKVLKKMILPIIHSTASSGFSLPPTIHPGYYIINAYTEMMRNTSVPFYSRTISVGQKKSDPPTTRKIAEFLLYPEGGSLYSGKKSKVAFKTTDSDGMPVESAGEIVNEAGEVLIKLASGSNGLGHFILRPNSSQRYFAKWKDSTGLVKTFELPVKKEGIKLEVTQSLDEVNFEVESIHQPPGQSTAFSILGHMHGELVYKANADFNQHKIVAGKIPVSQLPAGILSVSTVGLDNTLHNQRLVFVNKQKAVLTKGSGPFQITFNKEQKQFNLQYKDSLPVQLAVTVRDAKGQTAQENLVSAMTLASHLNTPVQYPDQYLSEMSDSLAQQLDLLMLTSSLKETDTAQPITHPESDYIQMKFQISNLTPRQLKDRKLIVVLESNKNPQILELPISKDGLAEINSLIFYDTVNIRYNFSDDRQGQLKAKARVDISTNLSDMRETGNKTLKNDNEKKYVGSPSTNSSNYNIKDSSSTKPVIKNSSKTDELSSGPFARGETVKFIPDNGESFFGGNYNTFQFLTNRLSNFVFNDTFPTWRGDQVTFFIDQVVVSSSQAEGIPMSDVAMIKCFRAPFVGGPLNTGGIAIYTRKNTGKSKIKSNEIAVGYTSFKSFAPDENTAGASSEIQETLYWNPSLLLNPQSPSAAFVVLRKSKSGKYKVRLEGFDSNGNLFHYEEVITE